MESGLNAKLPRPGDMVAGKYVVDRIIGQGGMGAVFAARHVKLSKPVAIKIMLAEAGNPEAAHRFINEGRAAANIQNEHVVRVDDVDEEHGYAYMVLELLDGEDLAQVLEREGRIPPQRAADYVLQALRGVHQAHAIGIVHRDLKPSNLFLARRKDGSVVVKVLDFGISKAQGASALLQSPNALTSTKAMLGSPLYMSPEQLRSSKSVDQRADIWAMGIILYELVTGTLPFAGDNLGELFAAILEQEVPRPSKLAPDLSPDFEAVVLRCLERRPENRFQDAAALMHALVPFAGRSEDSMVAIPSLGAHVPAPPSSPNFAPPPSPGAVTGGTPDNRGSTVAFPARPPSSPHFAPSQPAVGWQTTGGTTSSLPRTSPSGKTMGIVAGVFAALAIVGIALLVFAVSARKPVPDPSTSAEPPPPVTSLASAPPPVPPPPATLPAASVAPPVTAAPTPTQKPATVVPRPTSTPSTPASPPPTRSPSGDKLQNTR